ncbi:hypothetical protein [Nonomuraea zeae]|uniref:hypothetical protein n=1 Tax=Nonomuraea zeae TaxID=1642303 RepID=UPI001478711B|nr:hypothetical protein [Nonomuraea zeae]
MRSRSDALKTKRTVGGLGAKRTASFPLIVGPAPSLFREGTNQIQRLVISRHLAK